MLSAYAGLEWSIKTPLPHPQAGGAAALFHDNMIVAGGTAWANGVKLWLRETQVYDIVKDRWTMGPPLPEPLAYGAFAQSGSMLEVFGGTDGTAISRKIWTIDSSLKQWKQAGETPADLLLGRAARVGSKLFLFGGCSDVADLTRCSDAVWMREDNHEWRQVSKLPHGAVALAASAVLDGKIYLFGGCIMPSPGKLNNLAAAWSFDPTTFAWRQLKDIPDTARGASATTAAGKIFLFGGYTATAEQAAGKGPDFGFTAGVWAYDVAANTYTAHTPMPAAMTGIELFFHKDAFYGAGGEDRMRHRSESTFRGQLAGTTSR